MPNNYKISVIVPIYNEEENLEIFVERILPVLQGIGTYELIFCLDPSNDNTESVLELLTNKNKNIKCILFSRRFGQPVATMAGILNCSGEYCVVIDVDLQDPPELINELYEKACEGYDVVYAQRRSRDGETMIKKFISFTGYKLINQISEVAIPKNTGDFRIINRRIIENLRKFNETHGFLRGLIALIGFKQIPLIYDRAARLHGKSNYNIYFGSLKIAFNGIVSFSSSLLFFVFLLGSSFFCLSIFGIFFLIFTKLIMNFEYPLGFPSLAILVLSLGGLNLISIGLLGEYVGRIYDEVKRRPRFIVDKHINFTDLLDSGEYK